MTKTNPQNTKLASIRNPQALWGPSTAVKIPNPVTAPPVNIAMPNNTLLIHTRRIGLQAKEVLDAYRGSSRSKTTARLRPDPKQREPPSQSQFPPNRSKVPREVER